MEENKMGKNKTLKELREKLQQTVRDIKKTERMFAKLEKKSRMVKK